VAVQDDAAQAQFVVERVVLANREEGLPLKEQAVLFRTSHHSAVLGRALLTRTAPVEKLDVQLEAVLDAVAFARIPAEDIKMPVPHLLLKLCGRKILPKKPKTAGPLLPACSC
jgi:hypothetical protein